jgi:hypothetical protein
MTLQEAVASLEGSVRIELRDHAFGDTEVMWMKDGAEAGHGYYSAGIAECTIGDTMFRGKDAAEVRNCGKLQVERNDETGPDEYIEGQTMPGLTLEGVRQELTDADLEDLP